MGPKKTQRKHCHVNVVCMKAASLLMLVLMRIHVEACVLPTRRGERVADHVLLIPGIQQGV